jgi:phage gp29-like protein
MAIVDQHGTPITQEIASISRDPMLPLFSGLIQQNDDTLATRGQGKGIKLYEEIERDAYAFACLHKRKMAVISRPWEIKPASDSAIDQQAAEVVREQLDALGFDLVCLNLLDAINKGYAVGEVMWERAESQIVANEVRSRDQRRFWFGEHYELRLKTLDNLLPGEEMPERKFIVHSVGAKDGNPYGLGLGSKLFWPVWFKRQGITFWLTLLDKFGSPTAVGKYQAGTGLSDQQKLLDALAAISQDAGVTIPDGMVIELLEATRGGNAGYEQMIRYMDEQIAYCILGEAAGAKDSGGALASAAITRNEVRLELVQFDSDLLSATLNRTLIKWISEYNVPGAAPPTVWRKITAPEDMKARAERDQILFNMGMRPDDDYQAENYAGWSFPAKPEAGGTEVAFAEADAIHVSDQLAAQLSEQSSTGWNSILEQVRKMVGNATSLEALRDDLVTNFGDLPSEDLVKVMSAAFSVAELAGMSDVSDGH